MLKSLINKKLILLIAIALTIVSCNEPQQEKPQAAAPVAVDTVTSPHVKEEPKLEPLNASDITLREELLYKEYYLEDEYPYKDTTRSFKIDQIKEKLAFVESLEEEKGEWAVVRNYKNMNGQAPTVKGFVRNDYGRVSDSYGTERYQSAPLYDLNDQESPIRYANDGWLTHVLDTVGKFYKITPIKADKEEFLIPKRYLKQLGTDLKFHHVIIVDRGDQNIMTLERESRGTWLIRSKNPATTGLKKPPHQMPTPLGIFLLQQKKPKMIYLKDGSDEHGGYAPWASRFTNGGYIHGVPVNLPRTKPIEYSASLGTTPRSHMCVRNATSHAKFIYDWAPTEESLVIVIE